MRGGLRGKEGSGDGDDVGADGSINLGRVGRAVVGIGVSGGDHAGGGDLGRGCPAAAFIGRSAGAGGCGSGRDLPGERLDELKRKMTGMRRDRDQGIASTSKHGGQIAAIAKGKEVITYGSGGGGEGGSEEGGLDEDVGDVFGKEEEDDEEDDQSLDASEIIEGLIRSVFGRRERSKISMGDEEDMI